MIAKELGDRQKAGLAHAAAVQAEETRRGDLVEALADALERAGDSALHEASRLREPYAEHPIYLALPLVRGILGQQHARLVSHFEVVDPEVGRIGVGHIDGDQRNVGFLEDVSDMRSNVLLDLK